MKARHLRRAAPAKADALQIAAAHDRGLSPQQQEFNRLTIRVAALRAENLEAAEKFEALGSAFYKHIVPAYEAVARVRLALAEALEVAGLQAQLGKQQLHELGQCIMDLCAAAFAVHTPSPAAIALHDRWARHPYRDEDDASDQWEETPQALEDGLESVASQDNLETFADWEAETAARRDSRDQHRKKKATKAQQRAEAQERAAAELKSRSLRSIYISLAKLVHPDLEPDPALRAAKEEEMKRLAAAYDAGDLTILLQMELAWMHRHNDHLGQMAEAQLAIYVQLLRDQVQQLEAEKAGYYQEARFAHVLPYATGKQEAGIRKLKSDAKWLMQWVQATEAQIRVLNAAPTTAAVSAFIKELMQAARGDR